MLRFGIEMLQPSLLIEMAMPALAQQKGGGQPALPPADTATLIERIADFGFTLIELNTDLKSLGSLDAFFGQSPKDVRK